MGETSVKRISAGDDVSVEIPKNIERVSLECTQEISDINAKYLKDGYVKDDIDSYIAQANRELSKKRYSFAAKYYTPEIHTDITINPNSKTRSKDI